MLRWTGFANVAHSENSMTFVSARAWHCPMRKKRQDHAGALTEAGNALWYICQRREFAAITAAAPGHRPLGHRNKLSRCRLLGCVRCVRNPSLRPWLCQRAGAVLLAFPSMTCHENRNMNFITASSAPPIATDFTQNFACISVPGGRCNDHTGASQL